MNKKGVREVEVMIEVLVRGGTWVVVVGAAGDDRQAGRAAGRVNSLDLDELSEKLRVQNSNLGLRFRVTLEISLRKPKRKVDMLARGV